MTARGHHFVSRCYLDGFTNPQTGRLFAIDIVNAKTFTPSPKDVAHERDFNRIDVPNEPPDALERLISRFESDVAHALAKIRSTEAFAGDTDILAFMAMLFARNPTLRERHDAAVGQLAKFIGAFFASDPNAFRRRVDEMKTNGELDSEADAEEMRAALLGDNFKVRLTRDAHLDVEFNLLDGIYPYFIGRSWTLCVANKSTRGFITTDRPVSVSWEEGGRTDALGLGLHGTQILFPVSPRLLLWGRLRQNEPRRYVDDAFVARANRHILASTRRQVYARDNSFQYQRNGIVRNATDLLDDVAAYRAGKLGY